MPDPRRHGQPAPQQRTHACVARACHAQVPRHQLMCRTHWFRVPADVRASIWLAYRPGQERIGNVSAAYLDAVAEAVEAVANRGRRPA